MANRRFTQFLWNPHTMPVLIDLNVAIGGTGAVGTLKGTGVASVTRLAAGTYRIKLQDNYNKFFMALAAVDAPVSGGNVTAGSFATGTAYQITAVGSTDWNAIGLPAGLTAAVGMSFVATGAGSGTGTAKIFGPSGIVAVEALGDSNLELNPSGTNIGAYVTVVTLGATSSSVTTLIPTDPASGSTLRVMLYLSNSSVVVQGE